MTIELPIWAQVPDYPARVDRVLIEALWDEGVMNMASFVVSQRAAGANMSVDVSTGTAVVKGDDQSNQGSYLVKCTAAENITLDAAPGSNSRYDIIVLQINDTNAGGGVGDNAVIKFVKGTAAASPTVPAVPNSAIHLATLGPITSGTSSITTGIISSQRTLAGEKCMPGTVKPWYGAVLPNGWVWCAGGSAAAYPNLVAMGISTLPDLRGRAPFGLDNIGGTDAGRIGDANVLGTSGGGETRVLTANELPTHAHTVLPHQHGIGPHDHIGGSFSLGVPYDVVGGTVNPVIAVGPPESFGGDWNTSEESLVTDLQSPLTNSIGGQQPFSVMPPYQLVNYIIRT